MKARPRIRRLNLIKTVISTPRNLSYRCDFTCVEWSVCRAAHHSFVCDSRNLEMSPQHDRLTKWTAVRVQQVACHHEQERARLLSRYWHGSVCQTDGCMKKVKVPRKWCSINVRGVCVCACIRNGLAPSKRKPNLTWCHQIGVYFPPKRPKGSGLGQAQLRGSAVKGSVFASHSPSSMAFPPGLVDSSSKIAASFPQITAVFMAREEKRKR